MANHSTFWVVGEKGTPLHESCRCYFLQRRNWSTVHSFRTRNNKNKRKWSTKKKLAIVSKNVWNTIWKVSCKTLSEASFKTGSWDEKVETVLFATPSSKSFNKHNFKRCFWESTALILWWKIWYPTHLFRIVKTLGRPFSRKNTCKKLKQQQVSKSEIISITGHNA